MNNEMTCAHCKKKLCGPYLTIIVDAIKQDFCNEDHAAKFFKEQDRVILEEYARSQEAQEQK